MKKISNLIFYILGIVLVMAPLLLNDKYILHICVMMGIYMVLAISLNFLLGYTGLFSFGHATFYGIGAYASSLLTLKLGLPFELAFPLSGIITSLIGTTIAFPALRLRGIFLAIGTMGLNEIFCLLMTNWEELTGGPAGLPGIPKPSLFGYKFTAISDYYLFIIVFVFITYYIINNIIHSHHGRALMMIRDDEIAAKSVGVDIVKYKIIVFSISSFFAGLAGSVFAHYMTYVSPNNFGLTESFNIIAMLALGGIGNLTGSIVGAGILVAVPELVRELQEYSEIMYGGTIVLIMTLLPQGIVGWYNEKLNQLPTVNTAKK